LSGAAVTVNVPDSLVELHQDVVHADAAAMLRAMMRIRITEETLADLYKEQEMRTPTHFSIGQEAVAVGVCSALELDDVVYSGHRCHAHYLAKGGGLAAMIAELYGKQTGTAHGRGGSVHLSAPEVGFVASSAILGQTMAVATGSAWAFTMDGLQRVAVCFFGDGAIEEGIFHETLNFASIKRLPVIFVCENNGYSTHTPVDVRQPRGITIWERVHGYQMPSKFADGNDVFAVRQAAEEAVASARLGKGPYFLEFRTYRWREHVGPNWDYEAGYRTKAEVDAWIERCPVKAATARVLAEGMCSAEEIEDWRQDIQREVDVAVHAAKAAPFPSTEHLTDGTY
jgi:pyruvate dehydrogenase E1 component alpha subunit